MHRMLEGPRRPPFEPSDPTPVPVAASNPGAASAPVSAPVSGVAMSGSMAHAGARVIVVSRGAASAQRGMMVAWMDRMKTIFRLVMVAALGVAGCTSGGGGEGGSGGAGEGGSGGAGEGGSGGGSDAACADLAGKAFDSVGEHECGLGPNGPELCHWHISFSGSASGGLTYVWQYSDVGETGPVQCQDGVLTGQSQVSGQAPYAGTYDPATQALVWDGIDYQPAPQ